MGGEEEGAGGGAGQEGGVADVDGDSDSGVPFSHGNALQARRDKEKSSSQAADAHTHKRPPIHT